MSKPSKPRFSDHWRSAPGAKVQRYVGRFFNRTRTGTKIVARVKGNHGDYTVSIEAGEHSVTAVCSCYIGKGGYCHHCAALAQTFLDDPDSFPEVRPPERKQVGGLPELQAYLAGVTLEKSSPNSRRTASRRRRSPKASA